MARRLSQKSILCRSRSTLRRSRSTLRPKFRPYVEVVQPYVQSFDLTSKSFDLTSKVSTLRPKLNSDLTSKVSTLRFDLTLKISTLRRKFRPYVELFDLMSTLHQLRTEFATKGVAAPYRVFSLDLIPYSHCCLGMRLEVQKPWMLYIEPLGWLQ